MCKGVYLCVYACICVYMHASVCICMHLCVYACICVYMRVSVCMPVSVCVCMYLKNDLSCSCVADE